MIRNPYVRAGKEAHIIYISVVEIDHIAYVRPWYGSRNKDVLVFG